ncbi:MAG: hypothetical protein ACUVRX_00715 [Actinomycetota bacterium]
MTGKKRMLTALRRGEPDRVPVWEMAFNEESITKLGAYFTDDLPPMKLVQQMCMEEKAKLLNTLFTVVRELELDGITFITLLGTDRWTGNTCGTDGAGSCASARKGRPPRWEAPYPTPPT